MGDILDLSERYWRGEIPPRDMWRPTGKSEELAAGVHFFHAWANVTAIRTEAGLVLVDTGTYTARAKTFNAVRAVYADPLHAAIYTHGPVDHACGLPPFLAEARAKGWPQPSIVGHRNIAARFDRYRLTAPWINSKQFSTRSVWPTEYDYPTVVYDATHILEAGDTRPAHLADRPYLQAVYDEPEYVVRNIWRLYGGWWDGQPAHLKPAREAEIGLEVTALAGGAEATRRARSRRLGPRPPRGRLSPRGLGGRGGLG